MISFSDPEVLVYILPLRNENQGNKVTEAYNRMIGLYPTFKEWKPATKPYAWQESNKGLYPTFKEWKLVKNWYLFHT